MNSKKSIRLTGVVMLLVVVLLLADNNWMNGTTETVSISSKQVERSVGKNSRGHSTYFWVDSSKRKYKVPQWLYNELHTGDSFLVTRSVVFKKAICIYCSVNGYAIKENIGVVNDDWFGIALCVIALALAASVVFIPGIFNNQDQQLIALYLSILLVAVIIAFYFIFST